MSAIFETIKTRVEANPAKVAGLKAAYQFDLTGEGGGTFHAVFTGDSYDIGPGPAADPGCTVTVSAADFEQMVAGKLNATSAFMSGKLKIKGDMGLAMKLQSLLG
ncbi:MAG: SCP2 sterol-binding domain-containing protein [Bacillota bacterium]